MTEQEFDDLDERLRKGWEIRSEINECRNFLDMPQIEGDGRIIADKAPTQRHDKSLLRLPMEDLQPVLRSYVEKRLEVLIDALNSL